MKTIKIAAMAALLALAGTAVEAEELRLQNDQLDAVTAGFLPGLPGLSLGQLGPRLGTVQTTIVGLGIWSQLPMQNAPAREATLQQAGISPELLARSGTAGLLGGLR